MPFKKGQSGNPKGREKGVSNKTTQEFKEALNNLLEYAAPKMVGWLEQIAEDDPAKALEMINKYAEYAYPKLARRENTTRVVNKDGEDLHAKDMKILRDAGLL